jgi:hypothetical protein
MEDIVKSTTNELKKVLKNKDNKHAILASTIAYYLSNENKERNALIAGVLAYTVLSKVEDQDEE